MENLPTTNAAFWRPPQVTAAPERASWGAVIVVLSLLAMLTRRARRRRPGHFTA